MWLKMNKFRNIFAIVLITISSTFTVLSQEKEPKSQYDAKLAKKLGADTYGMKSYVMVILKTGPNDSKITDKEKRAKLFKGHFSNMTQLAKKGKLVLSGPFIGGKPRRGLFIFAVKTIEEAEKLVKTDPTVKAEIFVYDMTKLYGTAALMLVNKTHNKLKLKATLKVLLCLTFQKVYLNWYDQ